MRSPLCPAPPQRVDVKLDVGEGGLDYAEVAKKEHLSELELEIRKLNDKVKDVLAEQACVVSSPLTLAGGATHCLPRLARSPHPACRYQRQRELDFRKTSEAIHQKQQYWSLFQIAVSVAACIIQVTTLQRFFRGKKLA